MLGNHLSFTASPLLSPVLAPPGTDSRHGLRVIDRTLRAFCDAHLRGAPTWPVAPGPGDSDVLWRSE